MSQNMDERLLDLLCDKATGNLSDEEARELAELSAGANTEMDAHTLELTAAAILLAETQMEEMPPHMEAKLLKVADRHFAERNASLDGAGKLPARTIQYSEQKPSRSFFDWFGWAVAAAACIALVGTVYYNQQRVTTLQAQMEELRRPTPAPAKPTVAQQRDQLISEARDLTRASWTKGTVKESEGVSGEVVWSDEKQMGYMTFRGLPANDPNREAYQLWIFEQANLEAHPKDGGVFNVSETGEVIVPIEAKLRVEDPKAFAITVEKPGGVVVSGREKIAALAPVKPSQT
jgi:anti-sigma-K factor RskA